MISFRRFAEYKLIVEEAAFGGGKLEIELHEFFGLMLSTVSSELPKEEPEEEKLVFVKSEIVEIPGRVSQPALLRLVLEIRRS